RSAFPQAHIHYSAKANANLAVLDTLVRAGAGIDAVSGGEVYRARLANAAPEQIVFAGVGKTGQELYYAVEEGIGWFNVENVHEAHKLNTIACECSRQVRVALRFNPDVTANTHPHIATGHGGAKFGLTADAIRDLMAHQADMPYLDFAGIHIHIGSQLHDTAATLQAVRAALDLIAPYPTIRTVNIGGGLPVAYEDDESLPSAEDFAAALLPLLDGYELILEPGRSIIADAGMLVTRVIYLKEQGGQRFLITDAGMTDLIRPALYDAHHTVVPLQPREGERQTMQIVGPVCETTDVLARDAELPPIVRGDCLAVLTAGAYGMVMASNYNARPRPPEVAITEAGDRWFLARRRESWHDLVIHELDIP
ncbi:MAG: diaminopimelate decarboxylase, partial [Anaerolineae bacterium]|nr:diaminopimelate decarboxylase [Anaerolineae bacterium]